MIFPDHFVLFFNIWYFFYELFFVSLISWDYTVGKYQKLSSPLKVHNKFTPKMYAYYSGGCLPKAGKIVKFEEA